MTASGSIYTDDPWGGTFERPTVYASLDIIAALPGPELRVYSAHLKAGYTSRDSTLRLNQAIDDAADIVSARTSNPDLHVFYGGDFNSEIGDPPLNKLTEPVTSMIRLPMADPNNNSPTTRWPSGRRIDFVLFSGSLTSGIQEYYIFNTTTFASGSVPAPALADDSHTASDHLALVTVIDFPDTLLPDYEPDGDVDDDDFSHFASCRSGANVSVESGCENTDLDLDGDNDQADFGIFQRCFSGTNEPLDPTCIE
jgi:endonuclease/exonuclease/phosphatase family metal-dependent hydrolase